MKYINQISGMPQIQAALGGWMSKIKLEKVRQEIVDGLLEETIIEVNFQGTVQPLTAEKLKLKPEALRSWVWLQIHAVAGCLNLATNDKINYCGNKYKVMDKLDYSLNGFIEYHVVEDYAEEE